jgi:hypothetical protein
MPAQVVLNKLYDRIEKLTESKRAFSIPDRIGILFLYACRYRETGNECYIVTLEKHLSELLKIREYRDCSIYSGLSGVLWLLKFLQRIDLLAYIPKQTQNLEQIITQRFLSDLDTGNWDYFHGAAGHLIAIDKPEYYGLFFKSIFNRTTTDNQGYRQILSGYYPDCTNLGLHAGVLGILSICNRAVKKDIFSQEAIEIKKIVVDIILKKLEQTEYAYYPALWNSTIPCRMCWTYGELSLAVQLLDTGRLFNDKTLSCTGEKMLMQAANRKTLQDTNMLDAAILAGTSGNLLLFRAANKVCDNAFAESEVVWFSHTDNMLKLCDFYCIDRYSGHKTEDLSILSGLSGICLVLRQTDTFWQEYLLLNAA